MFFWTHENLRAKSYLLPIVLSVWIYIKNDFEYILKIPYFRN